MTGISLARSRPAVDVLECRTVPALIAEFNQGVLGVWGTDGPDEIILNQKLGRISVAGTTINNSGIEVASISVLAIRRIEIVGGEGDDQIFLDSHSVSGQSAITRPSYIWAQGGNDWVVGGEGRDTIDAGSGEDEIHGGGGSDYLLGTGAKVWLYGENGADTLDAESAQAVLDGGAGYDRLEVRGTGQSWLDGGPGYDRLLGGDGPDQMNGGSGNDTLLGYSGNDVLVGEAGNDRMFGGDGSDDLDGGTGQDTLWGGDQAFTETLLDGLDTFRDLFNWSQPTYLGTNLGDIRQMGAPTCALLASMGGAVAAGFNFGPSFIALGNSEYAVFLYDAVAKDWATETVFFDGTWTDLDANVPRTLSGAIKPEFWPVILQRGYLQFQGIDWSDPAQAENFRANPADAITALTSWDSRDVAIADARPFRLWQTLDAWNAVVASTYDLPADELFPGLVQNHAYTVIGMGLAGSEWFVQLRNPWGTDFETSTQPVPQGADDGFITIWWDDFVTNFSGYAHSV